MGKNKKIYLGLVAYPLVCMALIHIVMTVFYIIPLNPITAKYNPLIKAYMDPLFTQTWQLFAPSPISHNYTLLMKVDYKPENQQESIRSEWIDISTSLIEASQKNIISPYNKLVRVPMSGIHQSFHQDDIFLKIKNKKEKEDHTYGEQLSDKDQTHTNTTNLSEMDESLNSYREQGVQYIYRYSFAIAKQLFPADEIESVQLRVIVTDTVPFSERRNSEYNVHQEYFDFPKQTYQSISAPF